MQIRRETPIITTPRTTQLLALFDIPPAERSVVEWEPHLKLDERPWSIGAIVGPSGAGKSTLARHLFGNALIDGYDWPRDRSVVDAFPASCGIKDITALLTSVGFGSAPAWLRPFHVLSTGEQFRVTMARALAETSDADNLVVIDEFTSVVDRQVAKVASAAVAKTVRRSNRRLVVVCCHYDVLDWLQPDWVYQPHADEFNWRCLQRRPTFDLDVHPVDRAAWRVFAPHHYLSRELADAAHCFGGFIDGQCVAFTSYKHFPHPHAKNIKMAHRLVVLPDWQGLGIGGRLSDWQGQYLYERGYRYHFVIAHPAMIASLSKSPRWQHLRTGRMSSGGKRAVRSLKEHQKTFSVQRYSSTFVYVPPREALS